MYHVQPTKMLRNVRTPTKWQRSTNAHRSHSLPPTQHIHDAGEVRSCAGMRERTACLGNPIGIRTPRGSRLGLGMHFVLGIGPGAWSEQALAQLVSKNVGPDMLQTTMRAPKLAVFPHITRTEGNVLECSPGIVLLLTGLVVCSMSSNTSSKAHSIISNTFEADTQIGFDCGACRPIQSTL